MTVRKISRLGIAPLTAAVAAALGTQAVVPAAHAQAADDALPIELIVVTASRRETTVQELPFNITAVAAIRSNVSV